MNKITIRELHIKTGEWVRRAASGDDVVITDRGRPIATLAALSEQDLSTSFSNRSTLPEFEALPTIAGDSSQYVAEDRDRA